MFDGKRILHVIQVVQVQLVLSKAPACRGKQSWILGRVQVCVHISGLKDWKWRNLETSAMSVRLWQWVDKTCIDLPSVQEADTWRVVFVGSLPSADPTDLAGGSTRPPGDLCDLRLPCDPLARCCKSFCYSNGIDFGTQRLQRHQNRKSIEKPELFSQSWNQST